MDNIAYNREIQEELRRCKDLSLPKNYLVDATIERLGESFVKLFRDRIGEDVKEFLFLLFYQEFIEPETGRQRNLKEVRSHYLKNKYKKTKKNWYTSLIKSIQKPLKTPKELMAEVAYIEGGIEKSFIDLKEHYQVDSIDELIQNRLNEIEVWTKDDTKFIHEYKYIKDKTNLQIENALKVDAIMAVSQMVIEEFGGEFTAIVKEVSDLVSQFPLPGKSVPSKFKSNLANHDTESGSAIVDEYKSGDVTVTTLLGKELLSSQRTISLDDVDYDIYDYVMSKRDIEFVERQKIFVNIGEIVKSAYPNKSRGKKYYEQIIKRLLKLKDVSFRIRKENGDIVIFDLFDQVKFLDDGVRVEIKINELMHEQYIDNHVTKIYSDKIKNFNHPISENMVFILQKERFTHSMNSQSLDDGVTEVPYITYPYEFFTRRIRFPSRKKEANLKLIEESLQEIVANNTTVQEFKKVQDVFPIKFIPVSKREAEDLIETNTLKIEKIN